MPKVSDLLGTKNNFDYFKGKIHEADRANTNADFWLWTSSGINKWS
jgi:hypothetical protein